MSFLENLFSQGKQKDEFNDFVSRYDQGPPYQGISGEEAYNRYQQIAPQLPPEVYQQSATEAFSRMSPQERMQFGQILRQQAQQNGMDFPDLNRDGVDDRFQDPGFLAQMTGRMQQEQPGFVSQLFGGSGGGMLSGSSGNMLGNPLVKAALGGVAAMAAKRMMSGR